MSFPLQSALRVLARGWLISAVCAILAFAGTHAVLSRGWAPQKAVQAAAFSSSSFDLFDDLASKGIPEEILFVLFNGSATITLWIVLVLSLGLYDPGRADRFPRLLRWLARTDHRTLKWFWPFRARIVDDLRDVYAATFLLPFLVPVVVGLDMGLVLTAFSDRQDLLRSTVVGAALLVPHGLFELTALFLPGTFLGAWFRELEPSMLRGETSAVWGRVQEAISLRRLAPWAAVSLGLVVVAAVIEADATEPIARLVAGWIGYACE